jgi:hypothetical protein
MGPPLDSATGAKATQLAVPGRCGRAGCPRHLPRFRSGQAFNAGCVKEETPRLLGRGVSAYSLRQDPLAYCYYEIEADRRTAAQLLTHDEARRIAANVAKLPGLLNGREKS